MNRRVFLTPRPPAPTTFAFPQVLRAQSKDRSGSGSRAAHRAVSAIAADMKQARAGRRQLNAKGGILGRKVECSSATTSSSRRSALSGTQELIEKEGCQFIVGGLAAHVQMGSRADEEGEGVFISTSQSDEISAKPDTSPITFHEALNPRSLARGRQVGDENLAKKCGSSTRLRLGKAEQHGAHRNQQEARRHRARQYALPAGQRGVSATCEIQAAKPEVLVSCTPGADNIASSSR